MSAMPTQLTLPQLKESVCGCSLKAASKIIAWLFVVLSIFLLWITIVEACLNDKKGITRIFGEKFEECKTCERDFVNDRTNCYGYHYYAPESMGFVTLCIATALILSAILNSLLLVGIYNNRPNFIHAWVIAFSFGIFIDMITLISTLIVNTYNPFLRLWFLSLNIYCLLIVNSYHVNMKQASANTGPVPSAPPAYID